MIKEFSCPFAVFLLDEVINLKEVVGDTSTVYEPIEEYRKPIFIHPDFELTFKMRYKHPNYDFGCLEYEDSSNSFNGKSYMKKYRTDVIWDFGDGEKVNASSAKHLYSKPGKYTVKCLMFDIDKNTYINKYSFSVIVKEVLPTKISYFNPDEVKDEIYVCEPSLITTIECNLSTLVVNEPILIADRIFQRGETAVSYFDLPDTQMKHLEIYWTFLEKRYERDYSSNNILQPRLYPTESYNVEYEDVYCSFYRNGGKIKMKSYVIYPWSKGYVEHEIYFLDPNKNVEDEATYSNLNEGEDGYDDCHSMPIIVSDESELPLNVYKCGKRGFVDIFYKDDELGKKTLSFHYDLEGIKLENSGYENENYLNIIPIGNSFNVVDDDRKAYFALTSNGVLHDDLPPDSSSQKWVVDETYIKFLSMDMKYPAILLFLRKYKLDDEELHYIVKTFAGGVHDAGYDYTFATGIFDKEEVENPYYIKCNLDLKTQPFIKVKSTKFNENYGFDLRYLLTYIPTYSEIVVPKENYHEENIDRLIKVMTPHVMFEDSTNLKAALKAIFSHKNSLNKIITRIKSFVDDHSNYSRNYINQLLNYLNLLGCSVKEYSESNFDCVNSIRDFARIVSMNHNDLVGQTRISDPDISVNTIFKGKNVGNELYVTDILTINEKGNIVYVERNGKKYKVKNPDGLPIIICERNTFKTELVDFYMALGFVKEDDFYLPTMIDESNTSDIVSENDLLLLMEYYVKEDLENEYDGNRTSLGRYESSWGWNLLLPQCSESMREDVIRGYYSFYLYNPVETTIRENNFISEETLTDSVIDNDRWEGVDNKYGYIFRCFNKIILEEFGALNKTE